MNATNYRKKLICIICYILFLSLSLITNLYAQSCLTNFNLGENEYKLIDEKWYNFTSGRKGDQIVPNRLIVRLKNASNPVKHNFSNMGLYKVNPRKLPGGYYIIEIDEKQDPFTFAKKLEESLLFEHIEFDALGTFDSTPDDQYYNNQWGLGKISMSKAWNITTGSSSVIIGIIDTGIDYDHEDLDGNIWVNPGEDINSNGQPDFTSTGDLDGIDNDGNGYIDDLIGWDFYSGDNIPYTSITSHGTAVAGVVAAQTNNDTGVCGVAGGWDTQAGVKIMALRYYYYDSGPMFSTTALSIKYAVQNGAKIINISSSWSDTSSVIEAAIDTAVDYCNCIIVCSAGNNGGEESGDTLVRYPARYSKTIAVGAIDQNDERWCDSDKNGSAFGYNLDVVAPTESSGTYTTFPGSIYSNNFGKTSAAAPYVSGLAALIRSINPSLGWSTVKNIINTTATQINGYPNNPLFGKNEEIGYGRINAYKALKYTIEKYGGILTHDITVPSGDSLNFISSSVINLNSKSIIVSGGTITVENGAEINPYICIKESGTIKGLYPTISEALSAVTSGQEVIVMDSHVLSSDITVPTGKTLRIDSVATLGMNVYKILNNNGTIILEDPDCLSPNVCLKNGTTIKGYYPTLRDALEASTSGEVVELNSYHGLDDLLPLPTGVTLKLLANAELDLNGIDICDLLGYEGDIVIASEDATIIPDIRLMNGTTVEGLFSSINTAFNKGSVVEVRDTYTSSADVTVGSGKTLKPQSGSELIFAPGKYLDIYGTLNVNGATFSSTSSTSSWGGIKLRSTANAIINNCTITNALYGVYVKYVDPTIENCSIENYTSATSFGIYNYYGDPEIGNNYIETNYGVYNYNASPELKDNEIISDIYGLYCTANSSPTLADVVNSDGYNEFHGPTIIGASVSAVNNSNPIIGFTSCSSEEYGNNSFVYSFIDGKLVYAGTGCTVMAEHCWWGSSSPSSSLFYGNVDYLPCLTSVPSSMPGFSPENNLYDTRMILASTGTDSSSIDEGSQDLTRYYDDQWNLETKIEFIRYLYSLGEANGVVDLCKDIITEYPYQLEAFTALDMIYQISRNEKITKDFDKDMLKTYLKTFEGSRSNRFIKASAMLLLAGLEKDIERMDKVYKEHKDTYMGKYALQQEFMYFYLDVEDTLQAREILNEMDEVYPNEAVTYESHVLMGDEVMDPKEFYSWLHKQNTPEVLQSIPTDLADVIPDEYDLKAAYPNPFNPSTTLEYALPVQSEVKCGIYDIRGNLVKEYSYEQNAGIYSIIWNGSNVSSGIYLIRFVAEASDGSETFVDYQKVTLLK